MVLTRLSDASPGTLKKELDALTGVGLLNSQRVGNQVQFSANTHHPVYPELSALIRKTTGLHDQIASALQALGKWVEVALALWPVPRSPQTAMWM